MRRAALPFHVLLAGVLGVACGARTGDDDLLGYEDGDGDAGVGGSGGSGGSGSGGRTSVGGMTATGGNPAGGSSGGFGTCCGEHGDVGCSDPAVADCVCYSGPSPDPFCCQTSWDANCVVEAVLCGACGTGTGGAIGSGGAVATGGVIGAGGVVNTGGFGAGGSGGVIGAGGVVNTGGVVGTGGVVNTGGFGAGGIVGIGGSVATGGAGGGPSSCCSENQSGGAGCDDNQVQTCVCSVDAFCCGFGGGYWDFICAARAVIQCGADCF